MVSRDVPKLPPFLTVVFTVIISRMRGSSAFVLLVQDRRLRPTLDGNYGPLINLEPSRPSTVFIYLFIMPFYNNFT